MLELNQRWVHFYGVTLQSAPDDAPLFELENCLQILKQNFKDGSLHKLIHKGTACVRISHLHINKKYRRASFLFQYADSKISDPAFSDLVSGELRSEPKLQGEGIAVSAHAVIYLDPIKPNGLEYLMLLEDAPGIGKTKLTPFMNTLLKSYMTREYDSVDGGVLNCYPVIGFDHLASQSLLEDLERGELRFVELFKNQTIQELDEDPFLDKVTTTVKIKAVSNAHGQPAVDFINRAKDLGNEKGYPEMRVVFKRPEGKQRSVRMSTLREDAGDAVFGRMELVTTDYDLPQCAAEMDQEFLKKMRALK
ncbi:hypothetical protein MNO08_21315 [Pseudomonas simiae]|uniref:hypothetical protein n=1 Tax=Pseudomonas simiae TaxID=321846 RepID=UPI001F52EAC7|nr:hypothetical protein [Pseudomonas simiae]UNK65232.1 hypothetical protein MNO08_21315 [Pseudomonas simiae]